MNLTTNQEWCDNNVICFPVDCVLSGTSNNACGKTSLLQQQLTGRVMLAKPDQALHWNQCLERVSNSQDKAAFAELFKHFAPLLKIFLLKAGSITPEGAEELVQETMIKVWKKAPSFSATQASASTWIYTIARNTRIDWLRQQARRNSAGVTAEDLYDVPETQSPHTSLVRLRDEQLVRQQLELLPKEQSEVLSMMYIDGKSSQQIADALNLPLGTVKSRIRLALHKLKLGLLPDTQALSQVYSVSR